MNLSSKNENNTVYLEKVAVTDTKQFFGNTRPETKKIATFEGYCTWTARSVALASSWILIRDLAAKSICEVYEKRGC